MTQENKKLDYSELKDTDPIISYEQAEEAELVEFNSTWDNIVNTFKKNPLALAGLVIILLIVLAAILAPVICRYDPYTQDLRNALAKPRLSIFWAPIVLDVICSPEFCTVRVFL